MLSVIGGLLSGSLVAESANAERGLFSFPWPYGLGATVLAIVLLLGGWASVFGFRSPRVGRLATAASTLLFALSVLIGSDGWALHIVLIPTLVALPFALLLAMRRSARQHT